MRYEIIWGNKATIYSPIKKKKKKTQSLGMEPEPKVWGQSFELKKKKKKEIATSRIIYFGGQFNILSSIWVNNSNLIVEIGYIFKTTFFGLKAEE